mgnify:CR=1 FL=1
MYSTTLSLDNNEAVYPLINKNFNHFLIHQFQPTYSSEWVKSTITNKIISLENITTRKMSFDILCDLKKIKEISLLNIEFIQIIEDDPVWRNFIID